MKRHEKSRQALIRSLDEKKSQAERELFRGILQSFPSQKITHLEYMCEFWKELRERIPSS